MHDLKHGVARYKPCLDAREKQIRLQQQLVEDLPDIDLLLEEEEEREAAMDAPIPREEPVIIRIVVMQEVRSGGCLSIGLVYRFMVEG